MLLLPNALTIQAETEAEPEPIEPIILHQPEALRRRKAIMEHLGHMDHIMDAAGYMMAGMGRPHTEPETQEGGYEVQIDALSYDGRTIKKVSTVNVNKPGPRRGGKSLEMERLAQELLKNNPGAKLAKVSIQDGHQVVEVTEAGGELTKGADGIYRPKPESTP